jgi:hypothetical protein
MGRDWPDDFRGHSKASKKGWRGRRSTSKRRRRDADGYARSLSHTGRDWPDDFRGHSKASKKGWRGRKRSSSRKRRDASSRDWKGNPKLHKKAGHLGWQRVARPGWQPRTGFGKRHKDSWLNLSSGGGRRKGKKSRRRDASYHRGY